VAVGLTIIEAPVPSSVPPQLPLYQVHTAPVPRFPPFTVSVPELLRHTESVEAVIDVPALLESRTVRVTDLQMVLLQVPSARRKYVYVPATVGLTISELPVVSKLPPQLPLYHFHDAR